MKGGTIVRNDRSAVAATASGSSTTGM